MSDKELPTKGKAEPSKQQSQQKKKKKKNDPLRPQPAWLFPPDEHNPVLNPRPKSDAKVEAETKERLEAIDYLRHHSVFAPMKAAPPGQLLQLVAAFLTSYGFDSTSRVFTTERNARKKIEDWNDEIGKKFEKGTPSLLQIYQGWEREWQLQQAKKKAESGDVDDTSSEEEEEESSEEEVKETPEKKGKKKSKGSDSDSSDSDSDSDISSDDNKKPMRAAKKAATSVNGVKRKTASSNDSSSESDSDADSDDSEVAAKKQKVTKSKSKDVKTDAKAKQTNGVNGPKATVAVPAHEQAQKKAKVSPDSESAGESSSSSSDDSSDSDEETSRPVKKDKKAKVNGKDLKGVEKASTDSSKTLIEEPISAPAQSKKAKKASSDSSDASSDSDSDSESDESSESSSSESENNSKPKAKSKKSGKAKNEPASKASDSSAPKRKRSKSPKPSADASMAQAAKVQKKHNNVPFSRISKDQVIDPRLSSNAYVPYDYAQRAHEDLIVTRGKGFTKEKNKKKRGSYRGGIIDVGGGKGIKFDD